VYFERADSASVPFAAFSREAEGHPDAWRTAVRTHGFFRRAGVYWCATRVVEAVASGGLRTSRL
jgi:uncharacterized protein YycO